LPSFATAISSVLAEENKNFRSTRRIGLVHLEQILSSVLDRREQRAQRRQSHIAELRKRAAEADGKLNSHHGVDCCARSSPRRAQKR
jgi:hypothetical protein